ncbi:iron ABC transporter permease [Macrococcus hajekii]|uniref:Probable heme-iron transport system permease protein IsdF n=1 Tax=Macrococcus hajekii TaxID=198482 RepID=A0A4R6BJJ5_9STAP|nr:iron ABC transporter permease [Macrococcus hajekii]TDM01879.1 iron ABC transporter permease [Macrococcus hajekii]GGB08235.1 ferrichrome ABC transporter permease [Macrococcus hajekii]
MRTTVKNVMLSMVIVVAIIIILLISFCLGTVNYSIGQIFSAFFHYENIESHNIIRDIRVPRELGALLVGMALACSGAIMQGITKNALADPALLGLNAGASMMISMVLAFSENASFLVLMLAGFLGAVIGGTLVLLIGSSRRGGFSTMRIILAGAAISALLTALASGIALIFRLNQSITFWTAGGVAGTTWQQLAYAAPVILVIIVLVSMRGRQLTALSLGEEMAQGLGADTNRIRIFFSIMTMLLAGIAVSLVGSLVFVGLMVPHIVRFLVGTDYRLILPFSALLGGLSIVVADTIARLAGESPLGAIISIIGVPFFIYLVRRDGKLL